MLTRNVTDFQMNNTMRRKLIAALLCLPMLAACSQTQERNSENNLKPGDTVILNKDLTTPRGEYHMKFQLGEIKQKIQKYSNNCIIETRYKGPVTYTAGPYTVTKVQYEEEFFSDATATVEYSTTFHLEAQNVSGNATNKRFKLRCKVLDGTMAHHSFPVPDIKQVMGDIMDFNAAASAPSPEQLPEQLPEQPSDQSSSTPATASP
jgi:hypothetical protein